VGRVIAHDPEFIRSILPVGATIFGVLIPFNLQMSRPRGKMLNCVFVFAQHHQPPPPQSCLLCCINEAEAPARYNIYHTLARYAVDAWLDKSTVTTYYVPPRDIENIIHLLLVRIVLLSQLCSQRVGRFRLFSIDKHLFGNGYMKYPGFVEQLLVLWWAGGFIANSRGGGHNALLFLASHLCLPSGFLHEWFAHLLIGTFMDGPGASQIGGCIRG
jgi:hypothetical protein